MDFEIPFLVEKPLLLKGDCIKLLERIPTVSIDTIISDPPYFLGLTQNGKKGCLNDLTVAKPFYQQLFFEYRRVLKDTGCVYFFTDWKGVAFYLPIMEEMLGVKNCLVWDKKTGPGRYYNYSHEFILFHAPKNFKRKVGLNVIHNILSFANGAKNTNGEKIHPTQKPIELIEKFIKDSTNPNDVVLDSFMGSGTTGVACLNTKRRFVGMELDSRYYKLAKKRILKKSPVEEVEDDSCIKEPVVLNARVLKTPYLDEEVATENINKELLKELNDSFNEYMKNKKK